MKRKGKKKNSRHFCKHSLGILVRFTSFDHQITTPKLIRSYLKHEIDYISGKISFQSTKHKENHKKSHFAFISSYFSIR